MVEGTVGLVPSGGSGLGPVWFIATAKQAGLACTPPPNGAVAKALPYGSCVAQVVDGRQVIAHMAQDLGRHEGLQVGAAAVRGGGAG